MPLLVAVFLFSLEGVICEMIVNDVLNVQISTGISFSTNLESLMY